MVTRRRLLTGAAGLAVLGAAPARAAAILTDDGLYRQSWFLESFLELGDDLDGAGKSGKRFAIMWEQRGCPYCRETHLVNLARPDIENFVKANFEVLQLNLFGAREVTDFDGSKSSEKALAAKYGIRFTPTFQFFPDTVAGLAAKAPERARSRGCLAISIRTTSSPCSGSCARRRTRRRVSGTMCGRRGDNLRPHPIFIYAKPLP
jgi:thiol-disulfide isomerase/thioredoxin